MTLNDFLTRLEGVKGNGNQYYARCPAHDDKHQSLSVSGGGDGQIMVNCHAGCSAEHVVSAMALTMKDLFPDKQAEPTAPETWKEVETYPYIDLDGKYAEKIRKESNTGKKSFLWRQLKERGGWTYNRQGIGHVLYNHVALDGEEAVFLVEGEKDVNAIGKRGKIAVCGADGAGPGKWKPEYTEQLRGKHVTIIPDNDNVGKAFAIEEATALDGVAASVRVIDLTTIWPGLPEHGDASDLFAYMGDGAMDAILKLANETPEYAPGVVVHDAADCPIVPSSYSSQEADPPKLVFYDSVDYEEPEFLANPYIPLGKITILQGDSGIGKTKLVCKIAACVSRGAPIQDKPCEKGKVLILSVEDDPSTLRGNIEASGGDLTQCAFLENAHDLMFTSPVIEETVRENGIKLVIFDPLQAFLGQKMDMHRANETRPIMAHLAAMAKRTGCAVVIISHMSKGTAGGKAIYRALGSVDIVAAARSVLYVETNPQDEDQRVICHIKSSNAKAGQAILYTIGERGGVQWGGYSSLTYDDLQMQTERREKGVDYEDDPIVQVISMLNQDNPEGVFVSWEELDNYANKVLGYFPCSSGKEWHAKLKALQREITKRSQILFEFTKAYQQEHTEFGQAVIPESKARVRGVRIMPHRPKVVFQISALNEDEEDE